MAQAGAVLMVAIFLGVFPGTAHAAVSYTADEIAIVRLINEYRVSNGVDPVLVSDILSESSTRHSLDMAKYGFFSHTTVASDWFPAGTTPGGRMTASGYPANVAYGENIAAGYGSAASVLVAWKNSPPHNLNMLDSRWKVMGIGFETVPGSSNTTYWTTDFGGYVDGTAHENGEPLPPDVSPPTVSIASPGAGTEVKGSVTVSITANDNRGVTKVELYVGGAKIATDYEKPYAIIWDSATLNPGTYLLEARAFDAAGNSGASNATIHVSSSPGATTTTTSSSTTTTTTLPHSSTTTTTSTSTTTTTTVPGAGFRDVPSSSEFYRPIMTLAGAGVISGYSDGCFRPGNAVTRAQFSKIIVLALDEHTAALDNLGDPTFNDVDYSGAAYPFDYVEEAVGLNIIKGYSDGSFAPDSNVTRLQLAIMLVRAGGDALATPPAGYSCRFTDVPAYGREAVRVASYNGLLTGRTTTRFDPYSQATRAHVAKMVFGLIGVLE